jgi:putative hydrolase of the HAD superfamily
MFKAVLWDFGGVILTSPFDSFRRYEAQHDVPTDFIRSVNATNPHANAWALLERSDISAGEFDELFATESAELGHRIPGADVLALLSGEVRPEMVRMLDRVIAAGYRTACLTNNIVGGDGQDGHAGPGDGHEGDAEMPGDDRSEQIAAIMSRFDAIVESSKVGVRKPETRFYEIACELLDVLPIECVFLDDLGINLKPAAAMGMTTIKVTDSALAITALESVLGLA